MKSISSRRIRLGAVLTGAVMAGGLSLTALGLGHSGRSDDVARIQSATRVFHAIMKTPDKGIPKELLEGARCIAIIPGEKKLAFGIGGNYGKGLVSCRTAAGWSAPLFLQIGGGSWGLQLGGSSTDVVMVFMSRSGLNHLLSNKFKIGAGATAAAGPVGRHAEAATSASMHGKILTYSRSRGLFAGVSLNGAVVQPDDSGNRSMYGVVTNEAILNGQVKAPVVAAPLLRELNVYSAAARAENQ